MQNKNTGLRVRLNAEDWRRIVGKRELPVTSFQPHHFKSSDGKHVAAYLIDPTRLSETERGAIILRLVATGWDDERLLWALNNGIPIATNDCTPIM